MSALQSGPISAAGLDVFENEPLAADSPLRSLPNVVLTPHIGWTVEEVLIEFADIAADQLEQYLAGNLRRAELLDPDVVVASDCSRRPLGPGLDPMRITVIPGDGIGPELVRSAVAVMEAACERDDIRLELSEERGGAALYEETGEALLPGALDRLCAADGVLKGPVGLPEVRARRHRGRPAGRRAAYRPRHLRQRAARAAAARHRGADKANRATSTT